LGPGGSAIQAKSIADFDIAQAKGEYAGGAPMLASVQDQFENWGTTLKTLPKRQALVRVGVGKPEFIKTPTLPQLEVSDAQLRHVIKEYYRRYYTHRDDLRIPLGAAISVGPMSNKRGARIRP